MCSPYGFDLELDEIFMIWPGIRPCVNFTLQWLHVLFSAPTIPAAESNMVLDYETWRLKSQKSRGFVLFLSINMVDLPLRLKGWRKKVKVSRPLATSSKNLVANAWFLVALATNESQFEPCSYKWLIEARWWKKPRGTPGLQKQGRHNERNRLNMLNVCLSV